MSLRLNQVNKAVEHEINRILRVYFREEAIFITVVSAFLSSDLKGACVKFSVVGGDDMCRRAIKFFSKYSGSIQKKLCDRIQMRYTPRLRFELTDAVAQGNRIIEILDSIAKEETPGAKLV